MTQSVFKQKKHNVLLKNDRFISHKSADVLWLKKLVREACLKTSMLLFLMLANVALGIP